MFEFVVSYVYFILEKFNTVILSVFVVFKVRTDRSLSFYDGDDNPNVNILRDILLTYSFYNFDLGYCQVITCYKLYVGCFI